MPSLQVTPISCDFSYLRSQIPASAAMLDVIGVSQAVGQGTLHQGVAAEPTLLMGTRFQLAVVPRQSTDVPARFQ